MRDPEPGQAGADSRFFELALDAILSTVQDGQTVPLTRDGAVVAVVVPPEVAEAGLRALGRE